MKVQRLHQYLLAKARSDAEVILADRILQKSGPDAELSIEEIIAEQKRSPSLINFLNRRDRRIFRKLKAMSCLTVAAVRYCRSVANNNGVTVSKLTSAYVRSPLFPNHWLETLIRNNILKTSHTIPALEQLHEAGVDNKRLIRRLLKRYKKKFTTLITKLNQARILSEQLLWLLVKKHQSIKAFFCIIEFGFADKPLSQASIPRLFSAKQIQKYRKLGDHFAYCVEQDLSLAQINRLAKYKLHELKLLFAYCQANISDQQTLHNLINCLIEYPVVFTHSQRLLALGSFTQDACLAMTALILGGKEEQLAIFQHLIDDKVLTTANTTLILKLLGNDHAYRLFKNRWRKINSTLLQITPSNALKFLKLLVTSENFRQEIFAAIECHTLSIYRLPEYIIRHYEVSPDSPHRNNKAIAYFTDLHTTLQKIFEHTYLQPFKWTDKEDTRDGLLERELHGANHAARVVVYITALDAAIRNTLPLYHQKITLEIEGIFNLPFKYILKLNQYAGGHHDCARQGDREDLWEEESAQQMREFCLRLGFNEAIATFFMYVIYYKDKPNEFADVLKQYFLPLNTDQLLALQYLRALVAIADCLDIIRCCRRFNVSRCIELSDKLPFKDRQDYSTLLLEFATSAHKLIAQMGDMLYPCQIIYQGAPVTYPSMPQRASYDLGRKIQHEHADNVLGSILNIVYDDARLRPTAIALAHPDSNSWSLRPTFSPFIHATASPMLSFLSLTGMQLMSTQTMLDTFAIAPVTGEIKKGGLRYISSVCRPCFAQLRSRYNKRHYTLTSVLEKFSSNNYIVPNEDVLRVQIRNEVGQLRSKLFSNINILLVYLGRANALNIPLSKVITSHQIDIVRKHAGRAKCFLQFLLLLGTKIYPSTQLISKLFSGDMDDIERAINIHFNTQTFIDRLYRANIDLASIQDDNDAAALQALLKILKLPEKAACCSSSTLCFHDPIKPVIRELFCTSETLFKKLEDYCSREFLDSLLTLKDHSDLGSLIYNFVTCNLSKTFFTSMHVNIRHEISSLLKRLELFNKLIAGKQSLHRIPVKDNYYLQNPFPVVFVSERRDKIHLIFQHTNEFRAHSINIRTDITMLATDSHDNRLRLMRFLDEKNLTHIDVVLISDLDKASRSHQKPSSPYKSNRHAFYKDFDKRFALSTYTHSVTYLP